MSGWPTSVSTGMPFRHVANKWRLCRLRRTRQDGRLAAEMAPAGPETARLSRWIFNAGCRRPHTQRRPSCISGLRRISMRSPVRGSPTPFRVESHRDVSPENHWRRSRLPARLVRWPCLHRSRRAGIFLQEFFVLRLCACFFFYFAVRL